MNPLTELHSLTSLFPEGSPLVERAEHVPAALVPQPFREMLVHDHHMTVTLEGFHHSPVDVRVIAQTDDGDRYCREIVLVKRGTETVVQFGIVRFDFQYVTEAVRKESVAGKIPLGRVLINHNVLRHIDLGALLRITCGPRLAGYFGVEPGTVTYGRLATIFCNQLPAVDLLEIPAPVSGEPGA